MNSFSANASSMEPVIIIKDERFTQHLENIPHLENAKRVKAFESICDDPSLKGKWLEATPRLASVDELTLVHTSDHIRRVAQSAKKTLVSFDLDTQATAKSYEVARLGVGSVFSLLDEIQSQRARRGFACIRPPGHHAEPDKAMGFCLFNNVALGARYLKKNYSVDRVMIVDIDVHHGNGIQSAFYDSDDVLYVSLHQFPFYPGTGNFGEVGQGKGEGFTVNLPLAKGHGNRDFARIIYYLLNPLAEEYQPDIILVSCGFDLYQHDRLGGMNVTPEGYALMTFFLLDVAQKVCDGRIAFVMEGGYSLKGIRECGLRVMQELCEVPTLTKDRVEKVTRNSSKRLAEFEKMIEIQKKYWRLLR